MKNNIRPLIFLGDLHGNFNYVTWYIKAHKIKDAVIYQVGDFGIGFTNEYNDMNILDNLNKFLIEHNVHLYAIRGNHDNPKYFNGKFEKYFTNLHLLADYTVVDIDGVKILGVGGAISIDRKFRLGEMQQYTKVGVIKELYWYDEPFVLNEDKLKEFDGIDIVVTHTAPDFCMPINKVGFGTLVEHYALEDPTLKGELTEERNLVTKMYDILKEKNKPDFWFYGHFHNDWTANIEGTNYRLLNINEMYTYRNPKYYEL